MAASIRVGTCSFADEALTRSYYPRGIRTGAERLRHYATRFDTVEVDSTYYTLPVAEYAERWAAATPPEFVFHVKAFALMTRHPVRAAQLPPDLREVVEPDERGRVDRPSREVRAEVFARFRTALEPLRKAGKLGGILMQFPPYVVPRRESYDDIAWAKEQLGGDGMLVEFRHAAWLDEAERARTFAFLESVDASYVAVNAPRTGGRNVLPTIVTTTSPVAYVRMHGRNALNMEPARRKCRGAIRPSLRAGRARGMGGAVARARSGIGAGVRPVQHERTEPGSRRRGIRAPNAGRGEGERVDRARAGERRDAARSSALVRGSGERTGRRK